jgi:hypothetical protein
VSVFFPEVEGPIKAWLKTQTSVAALTEGGRHVYFAAPDLKTAKPSCWLTVRRIGGAPQAVVPLDQPLMSFEAWGRTKAAASKLAEATANALWALEGPITLSDDLVLLSSRVTLWLFQPDPTLSEHPRYVVDAVLVLRAATAA